MRNLLQNYWCAQSGICYLFSDVISKSNTNKASPGIERIFRTWKAALQDERITIACVVLKLGTLNTIIVFL